jgi:flagellar assembly protein FliH
MSNPRVIPREQLSAWEKWELASLNEVAAEAALLEEEVVEPDLPLAEEDFPVEVEPDLEPLPTESIDVPDADVPFPTAEELEAITHQAQSEGFEAGLEAGRLVAEDEANRLRAVLGNIESTLKKAEAALANEVLDLAVVIARQMVRDELNHSPERVLPILREALASLPAARSPSRVFLNPDDLVALEGMLGGDLPSDTWRLLPDTKLETGGCRIETPDSAVDLSLAVRWQNILSVLGRHDRADLAWAASEATTQLAAEAIAPTIPDDISAQFVAGDIAVSDEPAVEHVSTESGDLAVEQVLAEPGDSATEQVSTESGDLAVEQASAQSDDSASERASAVSGDATVEQASAEPDHHD